MENKKNKKIQVFSIILFLLLGIISYVRVTYADFNGLTGNITMEVIKVTYSSNYPDELNLSESISIYTGMINSNYFIEELMFKIPSNYVFYEWNTKRDGSGISYQVGKFHKLEENIGLYAIWGRYILGDVNLDGVVNLDDSNSLSKYIGDNSKLDGVVLANADVNLDGKVDFVDVDIIKQAYLGTKGYEDLLYNEPVFEFEIYNPSNDNEDEDDDISNNNGSGGNGNGTTNGGNNNSNNNNNSALGDANNNIDNGGSSSSSDNQGNGNNNNENVDDNLIANDNKKHKSYVWVFILGIVLVSLRISVDVIENTIKKNKIN